MPVSLPCDRPSSPTVLDRLRALARLQGLDDLEIRLGEIAGWLGPDLEILEADLAEVGRGHGLADRASRHLLDLEGKKLRPLLLLLAARAGRPDRAAARSLAVAVELVHSATLLHDDVVDLGDRRRGRPTARLVYGNAASIFAGDLLLVEAMRRIRAAGFADLLDAALEVIDDMIRAESIQLELRGSLATPAHRYLEVIEGKTASLFGWAARAGARAGGLDEASCERLAAFGVGVGVGFQIRDDILDFVGEGSGKDLLADLREGKSTYPLIWALERAPDLGRWLHGRLAAGDSLDPSDRRRVARALEETGAIEASRRLAAERTRAALTCLSNLDPAARGPLEAVALAALDRDL